MSLAGSASLNTAAASDTELVHATRAGEDDAFEELYRRYRRPVAAFACRIVLDHGRAEDVAQEAFVSALRRMRETESEIHFRPWIYGIARNAAIDTVRRAGRSEELSFEGPAGLAAADARQLAGSAPPETMVIDRERFENFRGALDELSEYHQRIIVMRELEGLSYREIGVRMHLSPASVESALFRARRKLEHEYAELDTGRRCQSMGLVIARLAEGVESRQDRIRLYRHARRCSTCRSRARRLGVEPMRARAACRRAAALLPLPGFVRRTHRLDLIAPPGSSHAQEAARLVATPGLEGALEGVGKAIILVASALTIGGMGATLDGGGNSKVDRDRQPVQARPGERDSSGATDRDPSVLRGGRLERRRSRPAAGGDRGPSGAPGRGAGRPEGAASAPTTSGPSRPGFPTLPPLVPKNLSRDHRLGLSVPVPPVAPRRLPALPTPSLPPVAPELPELPEIPGLPSASGKPSVGAAGLDPDFALSRLSDGSGPPS